VVLERLDKFNGEARVQITAGEYTQLTGRAGRRGIDPEGHSVILWGQQLDPNVVAGLASKRTYPLNSSFRPTYNMAVNLTAAFGAHRASQVLERSFAQFQADRSVVGLAQVISEKQTSLEGYEQAMQCHLGDFIQYSTIRSDISELERSGSSLRSRGGKDMQNTKLMRTHESKLADLKRQLRAHACHGCNEREAHARWGERYQKLRREVIQAVNQIEQRTNQVAKTFERICSLLTQLEYLKPDGDDLEVTAAGNRLAKIYGDRDLLIAECVNRGVWQQLDAASLASMAAALVYENRRDEGDYEPKLPKGEFREALVATEEIQQRLYELQEEFRLPKKVPWS
jgi:Superfamily II RNA helicase